MTSWRSVRGHIEKLDPSLTSDAEILAIFAEERILGRGRHDGDQGYDFELAIAGRRRRIATLDEEGTVFRGRSISDFAAHLQERLRKVAVEVGGVVLHGPIDLGSVDVDVDDFEGSASDTEGFANDAGAHGTDDAGAPHDSADDGVNSGDPKRDGLNGEAMPELDPGPMMVVADVSMAEISSIAAAENTPLAVSKLGDSRVMVAHESIDAYRRVFPRPSHVIALSTDRTQDENPMLIVDRDNTRATWDWTGELPIFEWIEKGSAAEEFVISELGAGAIARLAVADVIDAKFSSIREALLRDPRDGIAAFIRALGLPAEIADVLEGRADLSAIPNSQIMMARSSSAKFEETLAWEIAGEGVVEPSLMKAFRTLYVDRPWMVAVGSAVQSALAGAIVTAGYSRRQQGKAHKLIMTIGVATFASALTRIGTTTYMQQAVNRKESDIRTWQNVRDWQESQR